MHQELISRFERVFIDEKSIGSEVAERLKQIFPVEKIEIVNEPPFKDARGELSAREINRSKKNIFITPFKGQFFKRCPGSRPGLSCCNYFVLNWGLQCDMNCSYCYLQSFINTPALTIYSNLENALEELRSFSEIKNLRIGTGETVDSLSLDPLTLYSRRLIEFFKDYPTWSLEFKTKSAAVDQFLDAEHAGNVIVSWSVNPQYIIEREEHGTASLHERLKAAEKCLERGFKIAFHIDPMIYHPEWESSYSELIKEITARFKPADVPYMSVGALRFQPEQRTIMRERFGLKSLITQAETFPSHDGKMRYDARLREKMFRFVQDRFRADSPDWRIFMCMETPETWLKTTGASPFKEPHLTDLFDRKPLTETRAHGL